jgi:hypothetical protein
MKHKRVQPALAVPVLATALFFALLPVQAEEPAALMCSRPPELALFLPAASIIAA